jgi:hypothetical protein
VADLRLDGRHAPYVVEVGGPPVAITVQVTEGGRPRRGGGLVAEAYGFEHVAESGDGVLVLRGWPGSGETEASVRVTGPRAASAVVRIPRDDWSRVPAATVEIPEAWNLTVEVLGVASSAVDLLLERLDEESGTWSRAPIDARPLPGRTRNRGRRVLFVGHGDGLHRVRDPGIAVASVATRLRPGVEESVTFDVTGWFALQGVLELPAGDYPLPALVAVTHIRSGVPSPAATLEVPSDRSFPLRALPGDVLRVTVEDAFLRSATEPAWEGPVSEGAVVRIPLLARPILSFRLPATAGRAAAVAVRPSGESAWGAPATSRLAADGGTQVATPGPGTFDLWVVPRRAAPFLRLAVRADSDLGLLDVRPGSRLVVRGGRASSTVRVLCSGECPYERLGVWQGGPEPLVLHGLGPGRHEVQVMTWSSQEASSVHEAWIECDGERDVELELRPR